MRSRFDSQLETLEKLLTKMGALCEAAISKATKAIQDGDMALAKELMDSDDAIDNMEKNIERLCLKILLQQQPVARDLRRISAALKMITDMERIGDQTCDIGEIVLSSRDYSPRDSEKLGQMAVAVSAMVHDSVSAFVDKNLELARKVMLADEHVDQLFDEIRSDLAAELKSEGGGGTVILDLIMVSKYLERIGDHATNIAEWVEFSITGVHKSHIEERSEDLDLDIDIDD
ncbi:MAG: phosphate signaling complex protein PhoU [Lachnospiraceae bacterium]|nr:phosphate signaling complex protein PhoU [Lachnospiraceae bacterium]